MTPHGVLVIEPCPLFLHAWLGLVEAPDFGLFLAGHGARMDERSTLDGLCRASVALICLADAEIGPAAFEPLLSRAPNLAVVGLAYRVDGLTASTMRAAGATAVLAKGSRAVRVLGALLAAASGAAPDATEPIAPVASGAAWVPSGACPADALTRREREVLHLLSGGCSPGRIARDLALSRRTVESHLLKAYRKLGVSSQIEAIRAITGRSGSEPQGAPLREPA